MYKVETHNNSREYYENLVIENDAVYITANSSLSYMIKEVSKISNEDKWKVLDIEKFIRCLYPNWTSKINEIKLKGEIRKAIYEVRKVVKSEAEIKELKFLEDNISVVYSDFKYLVEAGIKELNYETYDIKLKLIKNIFNIFSKSNLFKNVSDEVLNVEKIRDFSKQLINSYLLKINKIDMNKARDIKRLIDNKNDSIKKIYFYNINTLDLRRYMIAEILRCSGFEIIFVIPYFKTLKVVNKCWTMVYGDTNLFDVKVNEKYCTPRRDRVKYVDFLEGRDILDSTDEKVYSKNYREVYDFKKEVKDKNIITLYEDSLNIITDNDNSNLKNHCYQTSIGRFLFNLYNCNIDDEELKIDFNTYREMITSGWIEYRGWNGLRLQSYLVDNAEYFSGVTTLNEIITRIEKLKELKEVSDVFYEQSKDRVKKNSTKQFLSNPFKAFGYIDVDKYNITVNNMLEVTLKLKKFLLKTFENEDGLVNVEEHFNLLMSLYRNKHIVSLYNSGSEIQKRVIKKIFVILNKPKEFGEEVHKDELIDLFNIKLKFNNKVLEDDNSKEFWIDQLEGLIYRDMILKKNNGTLYLGDMSYKSYEKYIEKLREFNKILSTNDLRFIFENNLKGRSKDIVLQGLKLQGNSKRARENYFKFTLANLFINYDGNIEFSWIQGLRKNDSKAIFFKQLELIYGKAQDELQFLDSNEFVNEEEINFNIINDYNYKEIINNVNSVPEVAFRDLDFCGDKFLYSSILQSNPVYYLDFHHKLAFSALISIFKNNIEDGYLNMLKFILPLFPQWKDVEKRNILDCEFSRKGLREYRYFEGINYPKSIDVLYLLKSKYIVTENSKIRNRYNKGEFNGERYYKEFIDEYLTDEQNNRGLHCKMCPHSYLCKKGEFVIDSK